MENPEPPKPSPLRQQILAGAAVVMLWLFAGLLLMVTYIDQNWGIYLTPAVTAGCAVMISVWLILKASNPYFLVFGICGAIVSMLLLWFPLKMFFHYI